MSILSISTPHPSCFASPSFTIGPARSPTLGVHIVIGQDGIRCNAFVLGWRIPMHYGDPLVCIWQKCPLDYHETSKASTLFASVSAKRRGLNWFRGNLKGSLRRDFDSLLYRTSVRLFLQTDSGTHMHQPRVKCLLSPMHRYHEPIRFHQTLVGHGSQTYLPGLIPTSIHVLST